jgi:hypothetical protein
MPETPMKPFLKIVDLDGDIVYVSPHWVVSIRPSNRKSFRDSGAEIKVTDSVETKTYFTGPGETTDAVVSWLGIENH